MIWFLFGPDYNGNPKWPCLVAIVVALCITIYKITEVMMR